METRNQQQIEYPFEVRIPMNGGNASLTRARYENLGKLIEGYRSQLELYSGNHSTTPYPVEIRGRREIRKIEEVVLGVKMGLPTKEILKKVEIKLWRQRLESLWRQRLESRFRN